MQPKPIGHYWVYPPHGEPKEIIFVCATETEIRHANENYPGVPHTFYPYHKTACDLSRTVFVY